MDQILVVVAPGEEEPWVTDSAAQLASETGATVTVLAVDDVESARFDPIPRSEHLAAAERAAGRAAEALAQAGTAAVARVRSGPAAAAAIEVAEEVGADLIVVGGARRSAIAERLLGSTALELVQRAGRQVMVVTPPQ